MQNKYTPGQVVGVNFLTQKEFKKEYFIDLFSKIEPQTPIIKEIINSFEIGEFTLNNQELDYVNNYPENTIEYIIFRYKFKIYPNKKILTDFPLYLLIEPVSYCNLKCKMCFQNDKFFAEKSNMGMIDFEFFKTIIDQAVEGGTKAITMASRGEPLLHKDFGKLLEYVKDKFFELKINTNATLLTEEKCHDILKNNVNIVVFSIDSAEKEQYESIRIGAKFERVAENVKKFKEIKEKYYPNSKTITRIAGVKCSSEQDFQKFDEFWGKLVDEVAYVNCVDRKDSYGNQETKVEYPCKLPWSRMYVWFDGLCNPCDFDYQSRLALGNAKTHSLKDIWNGEAFQTLRKDHLAGNRKEHHPCDVCTL